MVFLIRLLEYYIVVRQKILIHSDFFNYRSVFMAYSCLHSNISIGKNILILNELLPQSIFNFTEDVFEKCHQLINNYHSYIQRVESSCGRPKPKTIGCSGHNYGLLDCDSSMYLHSIGQR